MKKYIFFIIIVITMLCLQALACPFEFSSEDERPFFEQYDLENASTKEN